MDGHAYETMTRELVKDCGLTEYADPTTHQRARLFYWPSASKDAPVWHRAIDGAPLLWDGGIPASAITIRRGVSPRISGATTTTAGAGL